MGDDEQIYEQLDEVESKVIRLVKRIKNNRNRACLQNILTFANREESKMELDELKDTISKLVDRGIIRDEGKVGKESFAIVSKDVLEEVFIPETQEATNNGDRTISNGNVDVIPETQAICDQTVDAEFIHQKFYETLINRIKEEVNTAVKLEFKLCNEQSNVDELNIVNKSIECDVNKEDKLHNALISEITFLRNQLASKDSIIKMLINDRNCERSTSSITQDNYKKNGDNKTNKLDVYTTGIENNINAKHIMKETNDIERSNKGEFKNVTYKKKKMKRRTITILGDSMIKEVNPWLMQKKVGENDKIYKHSFNGAKIDQMHHHANAIMPFEPDLVILHAGTNNLRENTSAENIANEIVKLSTKLKTDKNEIIVSSIIERRDNMQDKVKQVNHFLNIKCQEQNLPFIINDNIKSDTHLKPIGVHLNKAGSSLLASNFINWINK